MTEFVVKPGDVIKVESGTGGDGGCLGCIGLIVIVVVWIIVIPLVLSALCSLFTSESEPNVPSIDPEIVETLSQEPQIDEYENTVSGYITKPYGEQEFYFKIPVAEPMFKNYEGTQYTMFEFNAVYTDNDLSPIYVKVYNNSGDLIHEFDDCLYLSMKLYDRGNLRFVVGSQNGYGRWVIKFY